MAYNYTIQRASFEESEDPKDLVVTEDSFNQAREALKNNPTFQPWISAFAYNSGRIDFQAQGGWNPEQEGVAQAAVVLAKQLNARIFGEDDEEYSF